MGFSTSFFVGLGREEIHFCGSETGRDTFLWA